MATIAFLGLGEMGARMASRLLAAGYEVAVWNRNPARALPLASQGARIALNVRDAVGHADLVFSMVRDNAAAQRVWCDSEDGALAAMREGALAIECSTLTPDTILMLSREGARRGITLVDAPVVGSLPQAAAGELVFLVGDSGTLMARIEPVLRAMGASVQACGAVGSGAAAKLLVNALFASQVAVLAELLGLSTRLGLSPQRLLEVMAATPVLSRSAQGAGTGMVSARFAPMFPLALAQKDMSYALQAAQAVDSPLPMVEAMTGVMGAAVKAGWAEQNLTVVARLYT